LFSDGITDQFGGADGRKFGKQRFRDLLVELAPLSMLDQHTTLRQTFQDWKGAHPQTDDVLVMGIRYLG
jgi:serine phosphatase RsbU (regulator of sigma subunit)